MDRELDEEIARIEELVGPTEKRSLMEELTKHLDKKDKDFVKDVLGPEADEQLKNVNIQKASKEMQDFFCDANRVVNSLDQLMNFIYKNLLPELERCKEKLRQSENDRNKLADELVTLKSQMIRRSPRNSKKT